MPEVVAISDAYALSATQGKLQGLLAPLVDRFRERWQASMKETRPGAHWISSDTT